jgi:hypothetical protein
MIAEIGQIDPERQRHREQVIVIADLKLPVVYVYRRHY